MYNPENVLISKLAMHLICGVSVLNWTDETTPRTERPVRFVWLSDRVYPSATPGVPSWRSYPPRVARGYMQSVRPVRFPA